MPSSTINIGFTPETCHESTPKCCDILETLNCCDKIIALSNEENLIRTNKSGDLLHGLVETPMLAFRKHLNLEISPDCFFLAILQAIAIDHKLHPELSTTITNVQKDSKKLLVVKTLCFDKNDHNEWEKIIFSKQDSFINQISEHISDEIMQDFTPNFTNTTSVNKIACAITTMNTFSTVFDYKVETRCGFNNIIMDGTLQDWIDLKNKVEKLLKYCSNQLQEKWRASLLPLLDVFIDEYQNKEITQNRINFWCSMCKLGGNVGGSGEKTWINGWINIFFPYINNELNKFCVPYDVNHKYVSNKNFFTEYLLKDQDGPLYQDFQTGKSKVPVIWDNQGTIINLNFYSGFHGIKYNEKTQIATPNIIWYIEEQ